MKTAELYIDGYIGSGVDEFSLSKLNDFVTVLNPSVTHLNVRINSGGGSVDEGFAIYDKLNSLPLTITTIAEGMVGSIATIIYLAGSERKMFENSKFFIHNPYFVPSSPLPIESRDAQKLADELRFEEEKILNFYLKKTGKKIEDIKPFMDAQTSFSSEQAINMGFATSIVQKETLNLKEYKLVAYHNSQITNNKMEKKEQEGWFKKIESMLKGLKNEVPTVVAKMTTTAEGVDVWYDGEVIVGTAIWIDEAMTSPAPDGVHTIDGVIATVVGGVVESIEVAPNEIDALVAENSTLKAEIEALKASAIEFENAKNENASKVAELEREIVAFKNVVIGGSVPKAEEQVVPKETKAPHKLDSLKNNLINKYGKK